MQVLCCIQFSFWCCDFVLLFLVAVVRETHWHISLVKYGVDGYEVLVVSCLEQFLFPIFLFVWSELEAQALLVLERSSSQLMPISAFDAVIVIFWITLDASIQEVYEIVIQFLWFLAVICINSILSFISFLLLLTLCGFVVSSSGGV